MKQLGKLITVLLFVVLFVQAPMCVFGDSVSETEDTVSEPSASHYISSPENETAGNSAETSGGRLSDKPPTHFVNQTENGLDNSAADRSLRSPGSRSGNQIGEVTVSMEVFTLGTGYLAEPAFIPLYEGDTALDVLLRMLEDNELEYEYTGGLDSSFYLVKVFGERVEAMPKNMSSVPAVLMNFLQEYKDGIRYDDDSLGEFDFTQGSGWMYSVNNEFPWYGFGSYMLQDGDVMRVQYTLSFGSDIGGNSAMGHGEGGDFYPVADKDEMTRILAKYKMEHGLIPQEYIAIISKLDDKSQINMPQVIFPQSTYAFLIPAKGSDSRTIKAKVYSAQGKEIIGAAVKYSLIQEDSAISVNSETGEVMVNETATPGPVFLKAEYAGNETLAKLIMVKGHTGGSIENIHTLVCRSCGNAFSAESASYEALGTTNYPATIMAAVCPQCHEQVIVTYPLVRAKPCLQSPRSYEDYNEQGHIAICSCDVGYGQIHQYSSDEDASCNLCGHVRISLEISVSGNFSVGGGVLLSGTVNRDCFRIAIAYRKIAINGKENDYMDWKEALGTNFVSTTVYPASPGTYEVTFHARDVTTDNPESEVYGTKAYFTIP